MFKTLFAAAVMVAIAFSGNSHAQDVGKLVGESDQFFAAVGAGKVPPADLLKSWTEERERLNTIAAAIKDTPLSQVHAKVNRRLGVANLMLSRGMGSEPADAYFAKAHDVLVELRLTDTPQGKGMLATVLKERADNQVLLGRADKALVMLADALLAVRQSDLKDRLGEATIRERLSGVHFRAERWKEALDIIKPAVAIMTPMADQPGFNREALRYPLWYVAICNSRLGNDAEGNFDRYLRFVGKDITPHDEADVYREAAVNISQRAPKEKGPERTAAFAKANGYLLTAKKVIDRSNKDEDVLEKVAIYTDLAVNYAIGGLRPESEKAFKDALDFGRKSPTVGNDSPVLIPILQRYATLLDDLGRKDEASAQRDEARRIEKLHQ